MNKFFLPFFSLVILTLGMMTERAAAVYCGNDPVNNVDVLGLAKVAFDEKNNLTGFGKAILGIAKDDPSAARSLLLAAQVNREITGANIESLIGDGDGGSVGNVLRAIDTAVGDARQDGREEWKRISYNVRGLSRDFDDGQATQSILVDRLFAQYAPALAANAANAAAFNAARRAASDRETAYQNSPGYKLREIGGAIADLPGHAAAFGISAAMATDVTTGNTLTWNGWGNGFGLAEVSPGERAFAASMVLLPMGRGGSFADDFIRAGTRSGSVDLMHVGQLGGRLFPEERIPSLVSYLDRRGIYLHEGINGSFDGVRKVMTLPKNPTVLNVRHEMSHYLDWKKYGDDYYKIFTPKQREDMVLERLMNNRIWSELDEAERVWSLGYPATIK